MAVNGILFLLGLFLGWGFTVAYYQSKLGAENHRSGRSWDYRSWTKDDPGYVVFKGIKKNGETEFNIKDLISSQSDEDELDKPLY